VLQKVPDKKLNGTYASGYSANDWSSTNYENNLLFIPEKFADYVKSRRLRPQPYRPRRPY
jgi:hypothetical protein